MSKQQSTCVQDADNEHDVDFGNSLRSELETRVQPENKVYNYIRKT